MNENKIKKTPFRLAFSSIRSNNLLISILIFAIVNLAGILGPFIFIFDHTLSGFYAPQGMTDLRMISFNWLFIPISLLSLLYLISSLEKKSSWILVIFILCLGIANYIYLNIRPGDYYGIIEWELFKVIFIGRLFGEYYRILLFYSIFGFLFVLFKSRKKEKVPDGDAS